MCSNSEDVALLLRSARTAVGTLVETSKSLRQRTGMPDRYQHPVVRLHLANLLRQASWNFCASPTLDKWIDEYTKQPRAGGLDNFVPGLVYVVAAYDIVLRSKTEVAKIYKRDVGKDTSLAKWEAVYADYLDVTLVYVALWSVLERRDLLKAMLQTVPVGARVVDPLAGWIRQRKGTLYRRSEILRCDDLRNFPSAWGVHGRLVKFTAYLRLVVEDMWESAIYPSADGEWYAAPPTPMETGEYKDINDELHLYLATSFETAKDPVLDRFNNSAACTWDQLQSKAKTGVHHNKM